VYYSALGDLAIYFFNGKKNILIAKGKEEKIEATVKEQNTDDTIEEICTGYLLGMERNISPEVNIDPLVPLDNDMLLIASKGFYGVLAEKNIQKILVDPMPVQTKVYRFLDMANIAGGEENISIQLISFYNLEHKERKFKVLEIPKRTGAKKKVEKKRCGKR
jgi:serine/threonine protein phosphatase PrpC